MFSIRYRREWVEWLVSAGTVEAGEVCTVVRSLAEPLVIGHNNEKRKGGSGKQRRLNSYSFHHPPTI